MAIQESLSTKQLTILTVAPMAGAETLVADVSRFKKPFGYNAIEFTVTGTAGSGTYEVLRWWPIDQTWRSEGPRGATPATVALTGADSVPVRVSVPVAECYLAIFRSAGAIAGEMALIEAQQR